MAVKYPGYCKDLPVNPGQWVKIHRGVKVRTRTGTQTTKRTYTVKVNHTLPGVSLHLGCRDPTTNEVSLNPLSDNDKETVLALYGTLNPTALWDKLVEVPKGDKIDLFLPIQNPSVCWIGGGGYYVDCDINQLEV